MATSWIGLAVAPKRDKLYAYQINTAGLKEGAVVVWDTGANGQLVKAPAAAAASGIAGIIADQLGSSGTVVGSDVNLQRDGIALVLLKNGQTVAAGDPLCVAGTDGSVRKAVNADSPCDIIGYSEVAHTAGATNEAIPARVNISQYNIGAS